MSGTVPPLAALVAAGALGLAACDQLPLTEFRNAGEQAVILPSEEAVFICWRSGAPTEVRSRGKARIVGVPQELVMRAGRCEYLYAVPASGLSYSYGAVNQIEIARDLRLYLRRVRRTDGSYRAVDRKTQPTGWPVSARSKTCR